MADKKEMMESFAAKVEADEGLRAKVEAALEVRDAKAIAYLAAEQGFELEESDFEFVEEADSEDADGTRSLSIDDLEGVTGGMKVIVIKDPKFISPILRLMFKVKKEQDA